MSVALLLISDGREDYLQRTLLSAVEHLPAFDQVIHVEDLGHELGFAGAIQHGWDQVQTDWCFHLEADFTFTERVDLDRMRAVLSRRPYLAQLVLKRQPWNADETIAGGIIEQHPEDYTETTDHSAFGDVWTEHRRFWSTNPSLYDTRFCNLGWPQEPRSEGVFTHRLLRDPHLRFGFWGGKADPPRVTHIGDVRAGVGY